MLAPDRRERELWLPPGRWVDWWRSVRLDDRRAYRLGEVRVLTGDRKQTLPAALGEPPLLLRAGALLPLLPGDVDTLAPYSAPGVVALADRAGSLRLLAVPRGNTRARLPDGGSARSLERRGRWTLTLRTHAANALGASRPRCARCAVPMRRVTRVAINGKALDRRRWGLNRRTGVLSLTARGRQLRIDVAGVR